MLGLKGRARLGEQAEAARNQDFCGAEEDLWVSAASDQPPFNTLQDVVAERRNQVKATPVISDTRVGVHSHLRIKSQNLKDTRKLSIVPTGRASAEYA